MISIAPAGSGATVGRYTRRCPRRSTSALTSTPPTSTMISPSSGVSDRLSENSTSLRAGMCRAVSIVVVRASGVSDPAGDACARAVRLVTAMSATHAIRTAVTLSAPNVGLAEGVRGPLGRMSSHVWLGRVATKSERVDDRAVAALNSGGRLSSQRTGVSRQRGEGTARLHEDMSDAAATP